MNIWKNLIYAKVTQAHLREKRTVVKVVLWRNWKFHSRSL